MTDIHIAFLIRDFQRTGAVKMMLSLAKELARRGYAVDFISIGRADAWELETSQGVEVIKLNSGRALLALHKVVRYLRRVRPAIMLATERYSGLPAIYSILLAHSSTQCVIRQDNTWSQDVHRLRWMQRKLVTFLTGYFFKYAKIVAVSRDVADDLCVQLPNLRNNVSVIYNPVISPRLYKLATEVISDEWYCNQSSRVIVAAGRLVAEKGFDVLLEAFAHIACTTTARLIILGEGPEGTALKSRIGSLGLSRRCKLVGYQANPYPWISGAALFVLPSRFEGLPTILIEALALNTPVIAADCPSGPREILANGKYGDLVPPDDSRALAAAMARRLETNRAKMPDLEAWLQQFTVKASVDKHVALINACVGDRGGMM